MRLPVALAQRGQAPDPVGAGHPVGDLDAERLGRQAHAVPVAVDEVGASRACVRRSPMARDWLSTCAFTYMTRRVGPPPPTQLVIRRSSSAGLARSIGISKIRDCVVAGAEQRLPAQLRRTRLAVAARIACSESLPMCQTYRVRSAGRAVHRLCAVPTVAIDVSEASVLPLRGWNRYVVELARRAADRRRRGPRLRPLDAAGKRARAAVGAGRPAARAAPRARRRGPLPELLSAASPALPGRRDDPRPRLRGLSRRLQREDGLEVPDVHAARRALRRADHLRLAATRPTTCPSATESTADKIRVIPLAPALPVGDAPAPEGPYLLAVGDLRAKKDPLTLVRAWKKLRDDGLPAPAGARRGATAARRTLCGRPRATSLSRSPATWTTPRSTR